MIYNTLKKNLGSNHLLSITMANILHPFQKAKMDNNSMKVFFVLKNQKHLAYVKTIHTCYFAYKSVVRGPKLDLIIGAYIQMYIEVYIGKMLIFNRKCLICICVAYKCHQNIFGHWTNI